MSARRPWRVHVHDIGPNFSFASAEKAHDAAARLVSGETWDGGARGLLGGYSIVTVFVDEASRPEPEDGILLRRWFYTPDGTVVEERIGESTGGRWERCFCGEEVR